MSQRKFSLTYAAYFLTILLVLSPGRIWAQATTGTIIGTVTDASGASVAGARIIIRNVDQNTTATVDTNESGNFTQSQLLPGRYELTIQKPGFQAFVQRNISVSIGGSTRLDARLDVGEQSQQVTVTEAPPGLETNNAQVTSRLSGAQIDQLPVVNRNFTNLNLLAPGATLNTFQH